MSHVRLAPLAAVLAMVAATGCGTARIITATPDGGVVAIPSNNNNWPFKYRDSADKLMARKCPNGYDIVQEEEVVVGQRSTTVAETVTPAGYGEGRPPAATAVVTSTRAEKEYRITFRARHPAPPLPPPVATQPVSFTAPELKPVPSGGLPPRPVPVAAH